MTKCHNQPQSTAEGKTQAITEVSRIRFGKICQICHCNPSNSCWDISSQNKRCVLPFFQHTGILFSPVLTVTMVLLSPRHFLTAAVDVNCDVQRVAGTEEWSVSPPTESLTLSYHLTATPPQRQLHGRSRQVTESCYNITHLCSSEVNTCSHIFV